MAPPRRLPRARATGPNRRRPNRESGGGRSFEDRGGQEPGNTDEPVDLIKDAFPDSYKRGHPFVWHITEQVARNTDIAKKMFPYTQEFIQNLFFNKHILFMGDSLTRGIYKDLVGILQSKNLLHPLTLKSKSENSHMHDRQIDFLPLDSDRVFRQAREYMTEYNLIQYVFTTRCMKDDVDKALLQMMRSKEYPDLIVMNSALWDLTRYFSDPSAIKCGAPYQKTSEEQMEYEQKNLEEYIQRLSMLMRRFRTILPPTTQVIWLCMPWPMPTGQSGLTGRIDTVKMRSLHRSLIFDGNYRAAQVVGSFGYDVLDLGFYLRNHSLYTYRVHDGVHWDVVGTRLMTELLVGHVAKNLGDKLPPEIKKALDDLKTESDGNFGAIYLKHTNAHTDLREEEDVTKLRGSYAVKLQRELAELSLKEMDEKTRDAIKEDIEAMRTSELIRQRELTIADEDQEEMEKMAAATPRVKNVLKTEWKTQRICLLPTSSSSGSSRTPSFD